MQATHRWTATPVHIRWMRRDDLSQVLSIESASFDYPWCEDDFITELRERNVIGYAAERCTDEDQRRGLYPVLGYMVYELHKHRIDMRNIAVHPAYRRQGIGSAMIRHVALKLTEERRNRLTIDVWEENLAAQLFLRSCGCKAIGIIEDAYDSPRGLHAYRFVLRSGEFAR